MAVTPKKPGVFFSSLSSLVAALAHADLVSTLQGDGPFTVFAPTDQAFADAGINLSTFDTPEENETLADILTYHVVSGAVMSSDLSDGMTAKAVNTDSLTFTVSADGVMVNDANVIVADVEVQMSFMSSIRYRCRQQMSQQSLKN